MEDTKELKTLIKLCVIAVTSVCYCYLIPVEIPNGISRLLSLLPVIFIFCILPLPISTVHLTFPTFFFLVWLGNFKLLLFAFNRGPLSSEPRLPLLTFISIALLPINPKKYTKIADPSPYPVPKPVVLAVKAVILAVIIDAYEYKENIHWSVIRGLYFAHIYFGFEIGFAVTALLVKIILGFGFEIKSHFNEPYLATSVQDLWGRRWNLMSSSILRVSVYNPMRAIWAPTLGPLCGQVVAILATFVVSGLMHELMFLYMMRVRPTWEVTCYFVVQGVCVAAEVVAKKVVNGRFRLHRVVSGSITMAFIFVTGCWLFFPQLLRNGVDVKIINEYSILLTEIRSQWMDF
ncbi:hypothetical protein R6Q59_033228 [Mikania micrantha]